MISCEVSASAWSRGKLCSVIDTADIFSPSCGKGTGLLYPQKWWVKVTGVGTSQARTGQVAPGALEQSSEGCLINP